MKKISKFIGIYVLNEFVLNNNQFLMFDYNHDEIDL